jgi:chorismate mutase/prephenate dehydratase
MAKKRTKKSAASTRKKVVRKKASKSGGTRSQVKKSASANKTTSKKAATKRNASARKTVKKAVPRNRKPSRESEIKQLDRNILRLINKRAVATTKRLEARKQAKAPLFEPQVEDALWAELGEANRGPLPNHAVRGVFREILSAARQNVKQIRIAYLGPAFSFTHLAAIERFGEWSDLVPVSTIAAVFEEVNRGHAEYGLVPIENSTDGRVVDTLHMFTRLPLRICGEVRMSVHHNLLARCPRGEVTEVYSKPQALSQCRDWLSRNMPQARHIEVTSTSTAAQLARDKQGAAAVASRQAAVEYDLQIIAEQIEDNANNVTRFAVIGHDTNKSTGNDRTALLLQVPHKPGALSDALAIFKKNKINLTWIESFPLRGPQGGYLFFLDFEGHEKEARVARTLQQLAVDAVALSILGSFPQSQPLD